MHNENKKNAIIFLRIQVKKNWIIYVHTHFFLNNNFILIFFSTLEYNSHLE